MKIEFTELELRQLHAIVLSAKFSSEQSSYMINLDVIDKVIKSIEEHEFADVGLEQWRKMLKQQDVSPAHVLGAVREPIFHHLISAYMNRADEMNKEVIIGDIQKMAFPFHLEYEKAENIYLDVVDFIK